MENIKIALGADVDEKYWKDLGFPIIESDDEYYHERIEKYNNSKNWKKIIIEKYEHSGVSFKVHYSNYNQQSEWDSSQFMVFYIKTENEELIKKFSEKLEDYFENYENWINNEWPIEETQMFCFCKDDEEIKNHIINQDYFKNLFNDEIQNLLVKDLKDFCNEKYDELFEKLIDNWEEVDYSIVKNLSDDQYIWDAYNSYYSECYEMNKEEISFENQFGDLEKKLNEQQGCSHLR